MNVKKDLSESELYNIGAAYCSGAEHCCSEVRAKLMRSTDDELCCERVLARLAADRYIDDERYSRAFIHDKLQFAKWGRKKIRQELWRKEIPESIYSEPLQQIDEEKYCTTLKDILEAKRRSVKGRDAYEIKMKLARFAASRGFEMNLIFDVLGED